MVHSQGLSGIVCSMILYAMAGNGAHAASVTLGWDASPSADVSGYAVYQGTASGTYTQRLDVGAQTSVTIADLVESVTYYFAVTAYTVAGVESTPSNEIAYTVPSGQIPRPYISSFRFTTEGPTLTWSCVPGRYYRVMCKDSLNAAQWTFLSPELFANGSTLQWVDTTASTKTQRIYSVIALP
jgi:hypothetical protein